MAEPFVITTTIDASGVGAGVGQTVDGLQQIEQAAAKSTEKLGGLNGEALGSIRTSRHLFEGLVELGEGGTAALGGLALEGRIVSEVFESMLGPLAPLAIILTTLAAVGIPALTKAWGENKEEAKKAAEETKAALEATLQAYGVYIDGIVAKQKDLLALDDRLRANAKESDGLAATAAKQEKERQLGSLRDQFLKDQAAPMTGAERDEIKKRYEAARKDIEDGSAVATANLDAQEKAQDLDIAKKKLADAKSGDAANTLEAARAANAAADAKKALDPYGISYDDKTKALTRVDPSTGKPVNPIEEQNKKITADEEALKHADLTYGVPDSAEKKQYTEEINQRLMAERRHRDDLQGYQRDLAIGGEAAKKFTPEKEAQREAEISKLEDDVATLKTQLAQATTGVTLANQTKTQDEAQRKLEAQGANDAGAAKSRIAQLEEQNRQLQRQMETATSKSEKEDLRKKIEHNQDLIRGDENPNQPVDPRLVRQGDPQPYTRTPARSADGVPVPPGESREQEAAQNAFDLAQRAHPALLAGINGLADHALQSAKLTEQLATSTDVRLRELAAALEVLRAKVHSTSNS